MGIHLRPGHKIEQGRRGWIPADYKDLLEDIKVGNIDLGYWGQKINQNSDGHTPLYSIPNPWASAYLYNFVLSDNSHPLSEFLIVQLLNLLSEYAIYRTVEIMELTEPNEDSDFYKFWSMAPDFIKYNNKIYFFREIKTRKILGGLSKSSLAWTSQQYIAKEEISNLLKNEGLVSFLHRAHQSGKPDSSRETFNTFWQHLLLAKIINTEVDSIEFESESLHEDWLNRPKLMDKKSSFYDDASQCFVFDENSLNRQLQIFNDRTNPPGLIEELKRKKGGDQLPMNLGNYKWVILDSLLERFWINQNKVERSESKSFISLYKGFLYPVKPEYLHMYKLRLGDLKIKGEMHIATQNARADIQWKEKRELSLNTEFISDARSLAIWPPFQSHYVNTYVIEYFVGGIENLEKLEFYDKEGRPIICSDPKHHAQENFRIYKLSKFPRFIRIKVRQRDDLIGGFVEVKEYTPSNRRGNIIIGVDFGTSHTSIAYSKDNGAPSLINFQRAKPIYIADRETLEPMLYNFLPPGLMDAKPENEKEWADHIPWQPFQTQWMDISKGNIKIDDLKFIEDGIIPFLHYAMGTIGNPIIGGLKWGAPIDISTYRSLFLKQLLIMAIVEAEAIGFEKLEIRWSYPSAFSCIQYQTLLGFWKSVLREINLINQ